MKEREGPPPELVRALKTLGGNASASANRPEYIALFPKETGPILYIVLAKGSLLPNFTSQRSCDGMTEFMPRSLSDRQPT